MSKKLNSEQFIERAQKVHGNHYDYSLLNYIGTRFKVTIICKEHGAFNQRASVHLQGQGCRKCADIKLSKLKADTKEQFVNKSKRVHGDKYDYSEVDYVNSQTKVKIVCPKHGIFEQKPNGHLSGLGCRVCGINSRTKTTKSFIKDSNKIHNNKYNYDKVIYRKSDEKVVITCPIHGDFEQTPSNHKIGKGCIKCAHEYVIQLNKERPNIWSYKGWEESGKNSQYFDSFKVYIIRCWNEEEEFYKIGKTYTTLERRFASTHMPYNYEVLKVFEDIAENISKLEHTLHRNNKKNDYIPKIHFAGMNECFKRVDLNE